MPMQSLHKLFASVSEILHKVVQIYYLKNVIIDCQKLYVYIFYVAFCENNVGLKDI